MFCPYCNAADSIAISSCYFCHFFSSLAPTHWVIFLTCLLSILNSLSLLKLVFRLSSGCFLIKAKSLPTQTYNLPFSICEASSYCYYNLYLYIIFEFSDVLNRNWSLQNAKSYETPNKSGTANSPIAHFHFCFFWWKILLSCYNTFLVIS